MVRYCSFQFPVFVFSGVDLLNNFYCHSGFFFFVYPFFLFVLSVQFSFIK